MTKPLLDTEGGRAWSSTSIGTRSSKQRRLRIWKRSAAVAFTSVMAVFAIVIWTLILTHERSTETEDTHNPKDAMATRTASSMIPVRAVQTPEKIAQVRSAPMTLGEDLFENALLATGAVIDGEIAGAYNVMTSASRESWPGERAQAPARASVSKDGGEPENRDPAKESTSHRKGAATVPREDAASEPSTVEISMTSKSEIPPSTSKTAVHSATVSESRMMQGAVTRVEVSPRARDEPHEARSGHSETRTTTDYQSPVKTYVVASGDSLWSISRQYKMTIDRLRSINELSDKHVIQPGQSLYVESAIDKRR